MEKKQLEFQIGPMGSLVPFAVLLIGIIYICIKGASTETSMALFALMGLMIGTFLVKSRWDYSEEIFVGMADPTVVVPVLCWLIAGPFDTILKSSGLVNGLIWAAPQVRLTGGALCAASSIVCAIHAPVTGTSIGTIIPCMAVTYPAGVIIGANLVVLAGAIVSGDCFGDNPVPISDTTVTSVKIDNAAIGDVVRSRLKYALVTAAIACVLLLTFGGGEMQSQTESVRIMAEFAALKTSPMVLPAMLVIFLAMRGHYLVESIVWGSLFAIVEALVLGFLKFSDLLFVANGAPQGILVNGVSGMFGLCIPVILLASMAHLSDYSGLLVQLREKLTERLITIRKKAEVPILLITGLLDAMINFSTVATLVAGSTLIKGIGKKFDISGVRFTNLMDCGACTVSYLLPYMVPLVAVMTVLDEVAAQYPGLVPQATVNQTVFAASYPVVMMATVLFAALTGWGSKNGEKTKS